MEVSLEIDKLQRGDVTLLKLSGKLRLGEATSLLRSSIHSCVAEGKSKLLVDLAKVSYVDSAGLGEFLASDRAAKKAGAEFVLVNVPPQIRGLMETTQLSTILTIFDDEEVALKHAGYVTPGAIPLTLFYESVLLRFRV